MPKIDHSKQNPIYYNEVNPPKAPSHHKKFENIFPRIVHAQGLKASMIRKRKKIVYRISLFVTIVFKAIRPNSHPWWHEVAPKLHLGAIPLKNFRHDEKIANRLGAKAVLSLLEDFEFKTKGIKSKPVNNYDWRRLGVTHLIIPSVDFKPLPLETLEQGVAFLEENIENGVSCYVHCKAGKGRSAAMVVAYLLKKGVVNSVDEGVDYLKKKRPFISIPKHKRHTLEHYYQKHCVNQDPAINV